MAREYETGSGYTFIVVDDDPLFREVIARAMRRWGSCHASSSALEASRVLDALPSLGGLLVDVGLQDGSGLDVLERVRRRFGDLPAIVFSGSLDRDAVNRTTRMNARFLVKPFGIDELMPFVQEVGRASTHDATQAAMTRWCLTSREQEILGSKLRGFSRGDYLATHNMSPNTYKTHVRNLLEKAGYHSLSELALDLLRPEEQRRTMEYDRSLGGASKPAQATGT